MAVAFVTGGTADEDGPGNDEREAVDRVPLDEDDAFAVDSNYDGSLLAVSGDTDNVVVYSIDDTDPIDLTEQHRFGDGEFLVCRSLVFARNENYLALGDARGDMTVFDGDDDFSIAATFDDADDDHWGVGWTDDSLLGASGDDRIHRWEMDDADPSNWTHSVVDTYDDTANSVDYNVETGLTAVTSLGSDADIYVYDDEYDELTAMSDPIDDSSRGVGWHPDGEYLAAGTNDNTVEVYDCTDDDPSEWDHTETFGDPGGTQWMTQFTPDGNWLISTGTDNSVHVFEVDGTPSSWSHETTFTENDTGRDLATIPGHSVVAAAMEDPSLYFYSFDEKDAPVLDTPIGDANSLMVAGNAIPDLKMANAGSEAGPRPIERRFDPE